MGLDLTLGVLYRLGDHPVLDGHPLLHAELLHDGAYPLGGEDAHEVVFQREIEARRAGVALAAGTAPELVIYPACLVSLRAQYVEPPELHHLVVLGVGGLLDSLIYDLPLLRRNLLRFLALLIQGLPGEEVGVAPEQDVGAPACHVGGDGHRAQAARLGHNLGLPLVLLGVEHVVGDAPALQPGREGLGVLDGDCPHEHRAAHLVELGDLLHHRGPLLRGGAVDHVGILGSDEGHVGGDDHHVEVVNFGELGRLGVRRARHASELIVHAEVVLEGDGGECLVLVGDGDLLFCLEGLVEALGVASPGHEPARELVHYDDLVVLDNVVHVDLEQSVGLEALVDVVEGLDVAGIVEVLHPQELLDPGDPLFAQGHRAGLLFYGVVLIALEARDDAVYGVVLFGGLLGGPGDDERGAGLVDEDRVDLIDDGVDVRALYVVGDIEFHIVPEKVKPKLVVGPVGDVAPVGLTPIFVVHIMLDDPDGEA